MKKIISYFIILLFLTICGFSQKTRAFSPKNKVKKKRERPSKGNSGIRGSVWSEAGIPLKNVLITLTHQNKVSIWKTKSSNKGRWGFMGLGSGEFIIDVTLDGYIPSSKLINIVRTYKNPPIKFILRKPEITVVDLKAKLKEAEKLYSEKEYDKALIKYNYVLKRAPKVYQIIFKIADCYREKNEKQKAIETYKSGIEMALDREDTISAAKAFGVIGNIFQKKKDLKTAIFYFKKSLDTDPKDALLAYNVAEFYNDFKNMKIDIAIEYYKMAIKIKPAWGLAYKKLGYAYLHKDDRKNANRAFEKFLEVEPDSEYSKQIKKIMKPKKLKRRRR